MEKKSVNGISFTLDIQGRKEKHLVMFNLRIIEEKKLASRI
jgi:hypothetical protein